MAEGGDALHVDDLTTMALVQAESGGTVVAVNGVPAGPSGGVALWFGKPCRWEL